MKYLVSLPESAAPHFHSLADVSPEDWFGTADPAGRRVGNGTAIERMLV